MADKWEEDLILEATVPADAEELASLAFFETGSLGVQTLPAEDGAVTLRAWFDAGLEAEALKKTLQERLHAFLPELALPVSSVREERRDWVEETRHSFVPVPIGQHFLIHASWNRPDDLEGRIPIQIDPGEAFGTGTHETTRLCLDLLERHFDPTTRRILDAGCGSGILMIGAALWLERMVPGVTRDTAVSLVGIDIEEPSVEVSRKNLAINAVPWTAEVIHGRLEDLEAAPFDWIFANILSGVILANRHKLDSLLRGGGRVILTGILAAEEKDILPPMQALGWQLLEKAREGEWAAFVFQKH